MPAVPQHISVKLTQAQRLVVAEVAPGLADRLKLAERNQRAIRFTLAELEAIRQKAGAALRHAITGRKENALWHVLDAATHVIEHLRGAGSNPGPRRLYQFKITLLDTRPPVWRRIQVKDGTLDKLHEHVQKAMGWTNSHLHHFRVGERLYGDPLLMQENFEEMGYEDSTRTRLSDILPKSGRWLRFGYDYDFGDGWQHEVLFEGRLRAERGATRSASRGRGPVRRKTWAACGATRSFWRSSPTPNTRATTGCWGGPAGLSTPNPSTRRRRPGRCGGGYRPGGAWRGGEQDHRPSRLFICSTR
jgi:hypothetical protein